MGDQLGSDPPPIQALPGFWEHLEWQHIPNLLTRDTWQCDWDGAVCDSWYGLLYLSKRFKFFSGEKIKSMKIWSAHWGEICLLLDCWNFFILQILQASSQIKHFSTQPWVWQSVSFWLWGFKREEFPLISSPCLSVYDFQRKFYVAHFHFEMQNARLFLPTEQIQAFLSLFFSISMLKILQSCARRQTLQNGGCRSVPRLRAIDFPSSVKRPSYAASANPRPPSTSPQPPTLITTATGWVSSSWFAINIDAPDLCHQGKTLKFPTMYLWRKNCLCPVSKS